jgi:endonuclease/exonuclease/phosphatase family metal-dependent hydrolase
MLDTTFDVFTRLYEHDEDLDNTDTADEEKASIREYMHTFCTHSVRPVSVHPLQDDHHPDDQQPCPHRITSIELDISTHYRNQFENRNESFSMSFEPTGVKTHVMIRIISSSLSGARHAINSNLMQLFTSKGGGLIRMSLPSTIEDWPEYHWRGVMIDVARHFTPLPLLKRTLDGMAMARLNTLHLHLTDAESFRVELHDTHDFPQLSNLAKLSSSSGETYSLRDLNEIIQYASALGIDVVPEVDVPAHVQSWAKTYPELVIMCEKAADVYGRTPRNVYTLDISSPRTIALVQEIISQVMTVFTSSTSSLHQHHYIHLGGDELHMDCWDESESMLQELQRRYNNTDYQAKRAMYTAFESTVMEFVSTKYGMKSVVWSGVQDNGAVPDSSSSSSPAIIEPWKCWGNLAIRAGMRAVDQKHQVLMSACWYLDFNHDWLEYFSTNVASLLPHDMMVGGEGAIWVEKTDHSNFECRVWPRLGAIASRLWGFDVEKRLIDPARNGNKTLGVNTKSVDLSLSSTKSLYLAFIHFRECLASVHHIKPAKLLFHVSKDDREEVFPLQFANAVDETQFIRENMSLHGMLSTDSRLQAKLKRGSVRITGQCPAITSEITTRPLEMGRVHISQVNVAGGDQDSLLTEYLRGKAVLGTILVGFCELNGWQRLKSSTTNNIADNRPLLDFLAADAGFAHSHIMVKENQPYNIGAMSPLPFIVLAEYGPEEGFQRGVLHLFLNQVGLHVLIAHLHAHDSSAREIEAGKIADMVKTIYHSEGPNAKIAVMGDLNTLSRWDEDEHRRMQFVDLLHRKDNPVWARLAKKFLVSDLSEVNYRPMDILLQAGLYDSCISYCAKESHGISSSWQVSKTSDPFSQCMAQHCLASEPTKFKVPVWEWPDIEELHPAVRLDYILVSFSIARGGLKDVVAGFDVNLTTSNMSDHYPMSASWKTTETFPLY